MKGEQNDNAQKSDLH